MVLSSCQDWDVLCDLLLVVVLGLVLLLLFLRLLGALSLENGGGDTVQVTPVWECQRLFRIDRDFKTMPPFDTRRSLRISISFHSTRYGSTRCKAPASTPVAEVAEIDIPSRLPLSMQQPSILQGLFPMAPTASPSRTHIQQSIHH